MDACMRTQSGQKTNANNEHSITLFFYKPTSWHGRVCCLIQRLLGFERPYSHVVLGTSAGTIYDYTTDGIQVFNNERGVWLEYYREADDVRTYTVAEENYNDLMIFLGIQLTSNFYIRWSDYAVPTLAHILGVELGWLPISCTAPALVALPIYTHSLAYLPAVLHQLLDIYEGSELQ
jgi:hypothetical protein